MRDISNTHRPLSTRCCSANLSGRYVNAPSDTRCLLMCATRRHSRAPRRAAPVRDDRSRPTPPTIVPTFSVHDSQTKPCTYLRQQVRRYYKMYDSQAQSYMFRMCEAVHISRQHFSVSRKEHFVSSQHSTRNSLLRFHEHSSTFST